LTGATGATSGAVNQILFSSGGSNLSNSQFIGIADVNPTEAKVQQVVAAGGTATTMRCFIESAPAANITFTLRKNGANTALTCTIPSGQTSGSGTGTATWVAGDLLDVQAPAANTPGKIGSFAIS